jgi:hypothetical protein
VSLDEGANLLERAASGAGWYLRERAIDSDIKVRAVIWPPRNATARHSSSKRTDAWNFGLFPAGRAHLRCVDGER